MKESDGNASLAELAVARRNGKKNAEIISKKLVKVFVTALDREDIEALSKALYRIPKTVEKSGERYHIMDHSIMGVGCAKRFGALNLSLIERILWAWVLTLPAAGGVAYLLVKAFRFCGWIP